MPEPEPSPQPSSDSLQREFERLRDAVDEYPSLQFLVDNIPDETPEPETPDSPADLDNEPDDSDQPQNSLLGWERNQMVVAQARHAEPVVTTRLEFSDFDTRGDGAPVKLAPRPVRLEDKKQALEDRQQVFQNAAVELNAQLKQGRIQSDEWLRRMMGEIKDLHTTAYAIGYSGRWDELSNKDWGQVGASIQHQYRYLRRWRQEILQEGLEEFSLAELNARAKMYGESASDPFEKGYAAEVGFPVGILPATPGDGTTICRSNCTCRIAINILDKQNQDFDWTWMLGGGEHCRTCVERADEWVQVEVRNGVHVEEPEPIFAR